jgi:hypothetical protein
VGILNTGIHPKAAGGGKVLGSVSNQKATTPTGSKPRGLPYPHTPCPNAFDIHADWPTGEPVQQFGTSIFIKIFSPLMRWEKGYLGNEFTAHQGVGDQNGDTRARVNKI